MAKYLHPLPGNKSLGRLLLAFLTDVAGGNVRRTRKLKAKPCLDVGSVVSSALCCWCVVKPFAGGMEI